MNSLGIDIIVPIHNSWHHASACLNSVVKNARGLWHLTIINDASDSYTSDKIHQFVAINRKSVSLIEHKQCIGYLKSVNEGITATSNDLVILLNSDAMLPVRGTQRLRDLFMRDEQIGIINPVSTWANWTRIPFPEGSSSISLESFVWSHGEDVPTHIGNASGFFFAVRRELYNKLGIFDLAYNPGYWEEADFCMRALQAGYKVVVDRRLYVYHHGWGTFLQSGRNENMDRNRVIFMNRWKDDFAKLEQWWKKADPVGALRNKVSSLCTEYNDTKAIKIRFLVNRLDNSWRAMFIAQIVNELIKKDIDANIVCMREPDEGFFDILPLIFRPLSLNSETIIKQFPECDILLVSELELVPTAIAIESKYSKTKVLHIVNELDVGSIAQTEPKFSNIERLLRLTTHKLTINPEIVNILKHYESNTTLLTTGVNLDIFYPRQKNRGNHILIRFSGENRDKSATFFARVCTFINKNFPEIEILALGDSYNDCEPPMDVRNCGNLRNWVDIAKLLNEVVLVWDLCPGDPQFCLQAMACGTLPVVNVEHSATYVLKHLHNCLLYQTEDEAELSKEIANLVFNQAEIRRIKRNGLETAAKLSHLKQADILESLFKV